MIKVRFDMDFLSISIMGNSEKEIEEIREWSTKNMNIDYMGGIMDTEAGIPPTRIYEFGIIVKKTSDLVKFKMMYGAKAIDA